MAGTDRITQEHIDVQRDELTAPSRITQKHIDVQRDELSAPARTTQQHIDVQRDELTAPSRITQIHLDVLFCPEAAPEEECRRNRIQLFRDWGPFWVRNPCQKIATRLERKKDWGALEATEYAWQRIHKPWDKVQPKREFEGIDVRLNEAFERVYDARKEWNPIEPTLAFDTLPERKVNRPLETAMPRSFP